MRLQPPFVIGCFAGLVRRLETVGHELVYGSHSVHESNHILRFVFCWDSRPPAEAFPTKQGLVGGETALPPLVVVNRNGSG